jgi:hypothetical protein
MANQYHQPPIVSEMQWIKDFLTKLLSDLDAVKTHAFATLQAAVS